MKNILNKKVIFTLILLLIIAVAAAVTYPLKMIGIGMGYKAKIACSALFVSGRSLDSVENQEFSANPVFKYITTTADMENKKVYTSFFKLLKREAVFRENAGCMVENDESTAPVPVTDELNAVRNQIKASELKKASSVNPELEKVLDEMFAENKPGLTKNTRAVLVIKDGLIVAERYAQGFTPDTKQLGWSMSKSATNALTGIRIKQGKLTLNQTNLLPEWENDERKNITLDSLLRMSSGLEFNEEYGNISDATRMLFLHEDMARFAYEKPLTKEIGEDWYYSSGTTNIISYIIRKTFLDDNEYHLFPYQELFSKLGMKDTLFETDEKGTFVGSSYMYATPRDWAKLGLLYLNDGVWNGERILPEGWVKYTSTPTPGAEKGKYGAQFWLNAGRAGEGRRWENLPENLYFMSGYEGQYVFIFPSQNMVVVRFGQTKNADKLGINEPLEKLITVK